MKCFSRPVRQGDELVCIVPACGLRWATDEDRPPCPRQANLATEEPRRIDPTYEAVQELRERLDRLELLCKQIKELLVI